ncbi:uncharacterized protein LOC107479731 [Arachis duranensis]|uniref:Uncharacterized protein LOC107479731 n=1 Tax=Arachis duranensis TaxID=130453 RepID=A0A6P4CQB8_ARADU|nr:uncharacterized protein LOC107479731 [Arachis duranensis]
MVWGKEPVKLLGRKVAYGILKRRLDTMWAKSGGINLIDVGNGFFVVRFYSEEDYWNVLEGGLWLLFDHYLTIHQWAPDFNAFGAEINKVTAWVRLPDLPIEYYDKQFLETVGDQIGKTLKVDMNTANRSRGKFARLCVELDLSKLLEAKYIVNGSTYYIEYEGLHMICFSCGRFGHVHDSCMNTSGQANSREEREGVLNQDGEENILGANEGSVQNMQEGGNQTVKGKEVISEYSKYSAWMVING